MSLRVGFDTSALDSEFKSHAHRGIGRYVTELKRFFERTSRPGVGVGWFNHREVRGSAGLAKVIDHLPFGRQTIRQQFVYPLYLNRVGDPPFDVLHFPAHMDAPSWCPKRYILTVLDLIPLVLHELYRAERPSWRYHLARWLEIRAIRNATLILAISEHTAQDVRQVLGIPAERIRVTPLGVDAKFFAATLRESEDALRQRYQVPPSRPLLLYVGGIDERKNVRGLLETLRYVIENSAARKLSAPLLVMAGKIQHDRQFPKLLSLCDELRLQGHVIIPGYIPDEDLLQIYAIAEAFLFMSLYEGFGLPPLEAMAAGLPVVSTNTSAMPEVLGSGAILVNPHDYRAAGEALLSILCDSERASSMREQGRRQARKFTWERTGTKTLDAYAELASIALPSMAS